MYNLVFSFESNDIELQEMLKKEFGELNYQAVKNFDGLNVFLTVIVPIASLTTQIIDFVVTHFTKKGNKNLPKRVLISKEGTIDLKNYDAKEVKLILESYLKNQRDEK